METGRLEAFSDGVLAIIITIMVLELKVPHGAGFGDLTPLLPVFLSYVLSFMYVGIYWNNHHHLLKAAERVNGRIMWANLILLFWLSLIPFVTGWMGENHLAALPAALYGFVLLMCAISYWFLQRAIILDQGPGSVLAAATGADWKGKSAPLFYLAGIGLSFVSSWLAVAIYLGMALWWVVPDRRISRALVGHREEPG